VTSAGYWSSCTKQMVDWWTSGRSQHFSHAWEGFFEEKRSIRIQKSVARSAWIEKAGLVSSTPKPPNQCTLGIDSGDSRSDRDPFRQRHTPQNRATVSWKHEGFNFPGAKEDLSSHRRGELKSGSDAAAAARGWEVRAREMASWMDGANLVPRSKRPVEEGECYT
jgi:hypothetical protein